MLTIAQVKLLQNYFLPVNPFIQLMLSNQQLSQYSTIIAATYLQQQKNLQKKLPANENLPAGSGKNGSKLGLLLPCPTLLNAANS